MSSERIPVMTRQGIVYCNLTTEGYVSLPDWVEGSRYECDNDNHLPGCQCPGIRLPLPNAPHDLDLWVEGPGSKLQCRGGVDPRPSAEKLSSLIKERDNMKKARIAAEELRVRALELNAQYSEKLAAANKELDTLRRRLQNVRKAANGAATEAATYGMPGGGGGGGGGGGKVPHMGA
jgi:hypothetical protein